jgi:hypothetical protein
MAINFPDSPSVNDTVSVGDRTWIWDGTVWKLAIATATIGGSNTQVQYNSSGSLAGSSNFAYDGTSTVTLSSTDAGSSAAPIIELYRNSSSPADSDYLGQIKFQGEDDGGGKVVYAKVTAKIDDASNTSEDGIIEITHQKAGSNNISARWTSNTLKLINGTGLEIADGLLTLGSTAVTATAAELNVLDGISVIQASSGSFVDNDTSLMTSASIQDKILSYGYSTTTGDITGVTAGTNLNGGGTSGAVTLNLDASPSLTKVLVGVGSSTAPSLSFSSDSNTGFYRVANGVIGVVCNSVLHQFKTDGLHLASGDWFRSYGTTGWYNGTYGGGWQMTDTTWVRTYGSKGMLCNGIAATLSATSSLSGYKYVVRNSTYTSFAYYTSSQDYKDQITPFTDSGAIVDALHPVTFVEKPDEEDSSEEAAWRAADLNYGFIAEDIAGDPLTAHLGQYDDVDGELKAEGWKWPDMISVLAAEVKSLRTRLTASEARIETLETA